MLPNLKALVVVLAIAAVMFALAKPICVRYMAPSAYNRRRLVWFVITIAAFASPSIWLYAMVAIPVMFFAARHDDNPWALYVLLMFAVPNASIPIPTVVISQLFEVTHSRIMAAAILLPMLLRKDLLGSKRLTAMDWALFAYLALQVALAMPYEYSTNTMRRGFLLFIDTFLVFYVFARAWPTRQALNEIVACFVLMCAILAPLAVFESLRGWLLYAGISSIWGAPNVFSFLLRGESLRALASTVHSIVLGHVFSLGIGLWIYLQSLEKPSTKNRAVFLLLCYGLFVTYSRGAWVSAALLVVICMAMRPGAARYLAKLLPTLAVVGVLIYFSPLKELLIDRLPIIGTADQGSIDYRRQLAEVSWQLIKLNPILGDPFVMRNMEELRQGQGIIDIVNAYASVTLFSGFVGLALFISLFLIVLGRCYAALRLWMSTDTDTAMLGVVLLACMLASLFFIGTAGIGLSEYLLAGLLATYARIAVPQAAPRMARHMGSEAAPIQSSLSRGGQGFRT